MGGIVSLACVRSGGWRRTPGWVPSKMWARVAGPVAGGDARMTAGLETGATRKAAAFILDCEP
jgi:hypothetical protein